LKRAVLFSIAALMLCIPLGVWGKSLGPDLPLAARLNGWGRLFGLLGFILLFIQLGLSSKVKLLERGAGLDRLLGLHQVAGLFTGLILILHPVFIVLSEKASGYSPPFGWVKALGLAGFILLMLTLAAPTIGKRVFSRYETWVALHRLGFVLLPLAFIHSFFFGGIPGRVPLSPLWVLILSAFAAILVHRAVRRYDHSRHPHRVLRVVEETPAVSTIVLEGRPLAQQAGQFVFLRLEQEGRVSEPHPFTIASPPRHEEIWLTIKAVGDFTRSIRNVASGTKVLLDGPYGVFTIPPDERRPLVFIAGGIGITPFLGMLRWLRDAKDPRRITLLWANRGRGDMFCLEELERMGTVLKGLKTVHILSRDPQWPGEKGHITGAVLKTHVPALAESRFLICGPPGFMRTVRRILKDLKVPRGRISQERFSYLLFGG
jgi:predicted ferric reductase